MAEGWRPVVGYEGRYEVSSHGRVRSLARTVTTVAVYLPGGIRRDVMVHVLVAEAFIGPRPTGVDVCHTNDVKTDNRPENLRYDTRSGNVKDSVRNGTHPASSRTHCKNGHEFTEENTHVSLVDGGIRRRCRACTTIRERGYRAARRLTNV